MNNNIVQFLNSKDKVELSAQVVELALADDIKKGLSDAEKELASVIKFKQAAVKQITDAITANRQAGIKATSVLSDIEKFEAQAKELGIALPAAQVAQRDNAKKIIADFKESQQKYISAKSSMS